MTKTPPATDDPIVSEADPIAELRADLDALRLTVARILMSEPLIRFPLPELPTENDE